MWRMCTKSAQSRSSCARAGSLGEISTSDSPIVGRPVSDALPGPAVAAEVVAGDARRAAPAARNVVGDLVDAEVVELGQHAGQVGHGRGARCATTSPARTPGQREHRRDPLARVGVERQLGHLEVQARP